MGVLDVGGGNADQARGLASYRAIVAALREVPGVEAVAVGQRLPLTSLDSSDRGVEVEGYTPARGEEIDDLLRVDRFRLFRRHRSAAGRGP